MTDYLYLDLETVPTTDPAAIERIGADIKPPATMKKAETIKAWEENDKAAAVLEAVAKTSFDGGYGSICSIAWAWNDDPVLKRVRLPDMKEALYLSEVVAEIIASRTQRHAYHQVQIVGHYVADFDVRFLWQRAFVLGVPMPVFLPKDPKPWSKEVFDTMQAWAGAKGSVSLDRLCRYLGIEGKGDVDGSMIAGMYARGEYDAIAAYNADDVEKVRKIHRKMRIAYGDAEE